MTIDPALVDIMACIQCRGRLDVANKGRALHCAHCEMQFPVRDGVPHMRLEEGVSTAAVARSAEAPVMKPSRVATLHLAAGPKKGADISLPLGSCKVVGRASQDGRQTGSYVEVSLALDDSTRKVIHQYVQRQFRRGEALPGTELGFRRSGDIILDDHAVSRLHAMFFFDEAGVGVLDLVSKNGTHVNGAEVEGCLLEVGDTVAIGSSQVVLQNIQAEGGEL